MINEPYKVSILVPIYGVEKYIERCARSLFGQTYKNIEYVFVDDCTPDRSIEVLLKVLDEFPNRKSRVKIVHHEKNKGLSGARHTAIDNATGDFVLHVDSDDWINNDTVEKLVNEQISTDADIVSGNAITECGPKIFFNVPPILNPHKMIISYLSSDNAHQVWGRLIKRELYKHVDAPIVGIDNGEDTQTMPMLFYYSNKLANVQESLYHYFLGNESSLTHKNNNINSKFEIQLIQSSLIVLDFFKGKDLEVEKQANLYLAFRIWGSLKRSAIVRNKKLFDEVLGYKNKVEGNPFKSVLGKYGRLKYSLSQHYNIFGIILNVKTALKKFISK